MRVISMMILYLRTLRYFHILRKRNKRETAYFWLLRHAYFQCHRCKIRTSLWLANILRTGLRSLKNEL